MFDESNNVFMTRSGPYAKGRPSFQGNPFASVEGLIGLGWRDLLRQEDMTFIFNSASKKLAFQLALEGAFDAEIVGVGLGVVWT